MHKRTGARMGNETLELRLQQMEERYNQLVDKVVAAGGKLYALGKDAKIEDIRAILVEIGGMYRTVERIGGKRK